MSATWFVSFVFCTLSHGAWPPCCLQSCSLHSKTRLHPHANWCAYDEFTIAIIVLDDYDSLYLIKTNLFETLCIVCVCIWGACALYVAVGAERSLFCHSRVLRVHFVFLPQPGVIGIMRARWCALYLTTIYWCRIFITMTDWSLFMFVINNFVE